MKKLLIVFVAIVVCVWLASDMWARGGRGGGAVAAVEGHAAVAVEEPERRRRFPAAARPPSGGGARGVAVAHRAMLLPGRRRCRGRALPTFKDRVAARLQTIAHRWVICPPGKSSRCGGRKSTRHRQHCQPAEYGHSTRRGNVANRPNVGNRPGAGNIANRPNVGNRPGTGARPGAGSGRRRITTGAGARPSTRDVQNFLNLPNAGLGGGNVGAGRPSSGLGNAAAIAGGALAGGAAAEFLGNRPSNALPGQREIEWMRVYRASPEIEWMPACRGNLEIESTPAFPVSRGIEWMLVYRASLGTERMLADRGSPVIESDAGLPVSRAIEWISVYPVSQVIESMPACRVDPEIGDLAGRACQTSVDPVVLVTTYKIFPAKLLTEASGRIGDRRISATSTTTGKTTGAMLVIGMAIVGGTTITSIIHTIQDSVSGQAPRGEDSPTGSITAGPSRSITTTETTSITKMARCITGISRCARSSSTSNRPRQSR